MREDVDTDKIRVGLQVWTSRGDRATRILLHVEIYSGYASYDPEKWVKHTYSFSLVRTSTLRVLTSLP